MAHSPEVRARLRGLYIGGLPLERAAEQAGIPYPTARNWYREARATGDDWDRMQNASLVVAGGGIEQALGRVIARGLARAEALLEALENAGDEQDPVETLKSLGTLGDTVAKLKAAAKGMMPEADQLAIENGAIKAFADLMIRLYPKSADTVVAAVEAWANGQR